MARNSFVDYMEKTGYLPLIPRRRKAAGEWHSYNAIGISGDVETHGLYLNKDEIATFYEAHGCICVSYGWCRDKVMKMNWSPKNTNIMVSNIPTPPEQITVTETGAVIYKVGGDPVASFEDPRELTPEEVHAVIEQRKPRLPTAVKDGAGMGTGTVTVGGKALRDKLEKMFSGGEIVPRPDDDTSGAGSAAYEMKSKFNSMGLIAVAVIAAIGVLVLGGMKR